MQFEYIGNKKISFFLKKRDLLYVINITGLFIFLSTVEMNSLFYIRNFSIYVNACKNQHSWHLYYV